MQIEFTHKETPDLLINKWAIEMNKRFSEGKKQMINK